MTVDKNEKTAVILMILILAGIAFVAFFSTQPPQCGCNSNGGSQTLWYPCEVTPCPGREGLNVESFQVNSPTNLTLRIRDTGPVVISLVSYRVKDANGNMFSKMNCPGPSMSPNQLVNVAILIDENKFTLVSGSSYTIDTITSRNNQFSFTINT